MSEYLFVYGTLRRGFGLPLTRQLAAHWKYAGKAKLKAVCFDLGDSPGAVADRSGTLKGDLYSLDNPGKVLSILDEYEGIDPKDPEGGEFIRKKAPVRLSSGRMLETWVYWYNGDQGGRKPLSFKDYLNYLKYKRTI